MQDPVEARHVRVELRLPVVGLDLGGQGIPREPQAGHERAGDPRPVRVRCGGGVGREGSGGAVELAQELGAGHALHLTVQTVREHRELLAQGGGCGGLAVRAREHGHSLGLTRHGGDGRHETVRRGQPDLLHGVLDAQRVGEVVDVLGGAREVHQGSEVPETQLRQAPSDEVLHRLHVVDRHGLELREFRHGGGVEAGHDGAQPRFLLGREGLQAGQGALLAQVDEPLDLHVHALAVQCGLRQVVHQGGGLRAVAAVQRPQRQGGALLAQGHSSGREGLRGIRHGSHSSTGQGAPARCEVPRRGACTAGHPGWPGRSESPVPAGRFSLGHAPF